MLYAEKKPRQKLIFPWNFALEKRYHMSIENQIFYSKNRTEAKKYT